MTTRAQTMSAPVAPVTRAPQGIVSQIAAVLLQPKTFFRGMPRGRHWVMIAGLVLIVFGFAASNQTQAGTSSTSQSTSSSQQQGFDLTLLQTDLTAQSTTQSTDATTQSTAATQTTADSTATDTNTTLMSALLAACGVVAMWAGQVLLLSLVPMLSGHPPRLGRSVQVAVWASLPLALMLALRQVYFAAGGTGGSVGLALLLDEWDGYASLSNGAQRLLAAFLSNVSLFSLWSLVLLYCGARYALKGRMWAASLIVLIWIVAVPAVTVLVSDPVTTVSPRVTTTSTSSSRSSSDSSSSSTTTTTTTQPMMDMSGGFMGSSSSGGQPPSGSGPSGGPP